jgi:hypothetical protein
MKDAQEAGQGSSDALEHRIAKLAEIAHEFSALVEAVRKAGGPFDPTFGELGQLPEELSQVDSQLCQVVEELRARYRPGPDLHGAHASTESWEAGRETTP